MRVRRLDTGAANLTIDCHDRSAELSGVEAIVRRGIVDASMYGRKVLGGRDAGEKINMIRRSLRALRWKIWPAVFIATLASVPCAFSEHGRDFSATYDLKDVSAMATAHPAPIQRSSQ